MVPAVPLEEDDALGASCSNRTVFLNLSGCSSLAGSDALFSHSVFFVLVFCDVTTTCVRMSNRDLHITSVPCFHRRVFCASLNSRSFLLFHSLCLRDSVFVCVHPCFSRQGSLNDLAIGPKDLEMVQLRACTIRTIIPTLECQCPCGSNSVCRQAKAHPPALLSSLLMCNSICAFCRGSSRADRPQRRAHGGRVQPDTVVPHSR